MRFAATLTALALLVFDPVAVLGQERTLADIRQQLSEIHVEILKLQRELSTTEGAGVTVAGDMLQRVDTIENELRRLTAETERLEFRISRIVRDGTNRVGDLEFRLCELETDCDIASLPRTPILGGEDVLLPDEPERVVEQAELAVGELADFERAKLALEGGDYRGAADLFREFSETYIGGPLDGDVHFLRGEALAGLGNTTEAARAYLESFSRYPNGNRAADALFRLGESLAELGQTVAACGAFGQVGVRFPDSVHVAEAEAERQRLGCS